MGLLNHAAWTSLYQDDRQIEAWETVKAYIRRDDLPAIEDGDRIYHHTGNGTHEPDDKRAVIFWSGDHLYALYACPYAADENTPSPFKETYVFDVIQGKCIGSIHDAIRRCNDTIHTEANYQERTHILLNMPGRAKYIDVTDSLLGASDNKLRSDIKLKGALIRYSDVLGIALNAAYPSQDRVPAFLHAKLDC